MERRDPELLRQRTKRFALDTIRLVQRLPWKPETQVIGRQLLRSSTSVGANYRAACRGRSRAEFIAKLGIVVEEADETVYWLELLTESGLAQNDVATRLLKESRELAAIFTASRYTATH
ncbi:MAG: four helix bundle protein [Terriglobales bacterium]